MNAFVFIFEKKRKLRGPETVRKTHSNTISRSTSRSSSSSRSRITNRQPIAQPIAMQVLAIAQSRVNASIHKFVICFYGRLPHKVPKKLARSERECWSIWCNVAGLQPPVTKRIGTGARRKAFSDAATLLASGIAAGGC